MTPTPPAGLVHAHSARLVALCSLLLCAAGGMATHAIAAEAYVPVQPDPMREAWRWRRLDQLDGLGFRCMAEAADGSVWFGVREQLVHFDGLHERVFGAAEGVIGAPVKSVHVARNGGVYALTRTRFLRFDGQRWQPLATIDNQAVPGNRLREGPDGAIWALTPDEIFCYREGTLLRVAEIPRPLAELSIDSRNTLWLIPRDGGAVWECPVENGALARRDTWIAHQVFPPDTSAEFNALVARDGSLWIGTGNEKLPLARFSTAERAWEHVDLRAKGGTLHTYGLAEAPDGSVWIAGRGRLHSIRGKDVTVYTQADLSSIPFYRYAVHATRDGALWLCGIGGYIERIDRSDRRWSSYDDLGFQAAGPDGVRWFVARGGRIVAHDPGRKTWTQFTTADGLMDRPVVVAVSRDGTVWAAGADKDQAAVARLEGTRWRLHRHGTFARGIARQSVYETRAGDMLFGAEFEPAASPGCTGGLLRYRREGGEWRVTSIAPPAAPFRIISIAEGGDGSLWLGGETLWRMKGERAIETGFPLATEQRGSFHVTRDAAGAIWIAKWGGGVFRYAQDRWDHFGDADGLASNLVAAVAGAPDGTVWAASPGVLSRFDGRHWAEAALPPHFGLDLGPSHLRVESDNAVWVVTTAQGWYAPLRPRARANPGAAPAGSLRSSCFRPDDDHPETVLQPAPGRVLEKEPAVFVWRAWDRWNETPADRLEFSHRVDEGPWSRYSGARSLVLAHLQPGTHTLEVRARDRDSNVDPTPARAVFVVVPPAWRQPWFIALVAVFVVALALLVWLLVRMRIASVLQLGELKAQFFTNISHELRTPLTVILGPLDRMLGEAREPRARERLETIRQNATHMLGLVNQILDFRRLQLRAPDLALEPVEVVSLLRAQHERFRAYADEKRMAFGFRAEPAEICVLVDRDALTKIADNLVANAIKYTPAGGEVLVEVAAEPAGGVAGARRMTLALRVSDSGIGIPEAEQERIFDLFYRAPGARGSLVRGAGLGLTFTRELVERHGGSITVLSPAFPPHDPVRGSCFTVLLRVDRHTAPAGQGPLGGAPSLPPQTAHPSVAGPVGRPTLLIVEDNADLRRLLRDEFEPAYAVVEAENGARGLEIAERHMPDCVIADVMMPEMDGDALCARLKSQELTAHIPVILLTALTSAECQLRGLGAGADDYVAKPVSFAVLKARVQNLIAARARLRERFGRQVFLAPQELAITTADEQFIQRALQVVEAHIGDEEFDVERLARALGMSRASLFRRFKGISRQSPSEFIRDMRLERARQLLRAGRHNVSQTAAEVGFLDLSHFAACFRQKFGMSPSEVLRESGRAPVTKR